MDNTELFTNVPVGIDGVFKHVYQILVTHWKPLLGIAGIQIVSVFITTIALSIFSMIVAASAIGSIMSALQNIPDRSRYLLDYSTGVSGASRLLRATEEMGVNDYYDFDFPGTAIIISLIFVILLWIVVIALVGSIFTGAFNHAVAEIYAGSVDPCADRSIKFGMKKMFSVFSFQLLVILSTVGIMLVTLVIPIAYEIVEESYSAGLLIFGILVFTISIFLFGAAMTAAVPSIVVEGKSPVQAYKRSWNLCKNFLCFTACTVFACNCGVLVFALGSYAILGKLPPVIGIVGHLAINLLTMMISPLLQHVLYMSMRIRTENATPEDIAQEIGFSLSDYSQVQLADMADKVYSVQEARPVV